MDITEKIREIKDFPRLGIGFKDISPLLADGKYYSHSIKELAKFCRKVGAEIIVGPEARGFLIGAPIAYELECGFIPVRKPGKLPADTIRVEYQLEYGTDILEIHKDAIKPGQRVIIADDLLATGGTTIATGKLIELLGGQVVGCVFLIELEFLKGKEKFDYEIFSLIQY